MRFLVFNSFMVCLLFLAWYCGLFAAIYSLCSYEYILLAALCVYASVGFVAAAKQKWSVVDHVANGIPMWALAATGLGMSLSVFTISNAAVSLIPIFKTIALSIVPNILGIALMAWLREVAYWCGNEDIS